jgi:hypothetical protein
MHEVLTSDAGVNEREDRKLKLEETATVSCEVRTAHTVYLCVPYGSHSKQRLFPHTALTGWAL